MHAKGRQSRDNSFLNKGSIRQQEEISGEDESKEAGREAGWESLLFQAAWGVQK